MPLENVNLQNRGSRSPESTLRGSQFKSRLGIKLKIWPGRTQNQSQIQKDSETVLKPKLNSTNLTRNKVLGNEQSRNQIPTHAPRMDSIRAGMG